MNPVLRFPKLQLSLEKVALPVGYEPGKPLASTPHAELWPTPALWP